MSNQIDHAAALAAARTPNVTALTDYLLDAEYADFRSMCQAKPGLNDGVPRPLPGLSDTDLARWETAWELFAEGEDESMPEAERDWFAANGAGHVWCEVIRARGDGRVNLQLLAKAEGMSPDAPVDEIFRGRRIDPADYAEEMHQFISSSGMGAAFADFLAGQILLQERSIELVDSAEPSL
ncbi:hypothetical protein [Pseudomonas aeruginosa]|uniref:hypothetical protein n=1 Tax=Pseudomonas aeruginosa TaxID=287 RepID=UPI001EC28ED9|nr:hypothetical protein [Pseudomonas aeruginosa]MBX6882299.1 hypothetical protein [Pseudomonas aeruginosa]MBX6932751.1 hypothetical protein [Pseudomonas aeruginosa]MCZ9867102.1 hypothetical protein [Pseudomonas aeruginosa]MCZ9906496.1 hypothetical protein [Pseudomonas aeruginosa]WHV60888.1 hypothetical protein M2I93_32680 [Pseudomonas aeruginosa]